MKFKLSFIAILFCTLFFACKKNEIINDDTVKVSAAGGATQNTPGGPIITTPIDIPSGMVFPCNLFNVPFYIFATIDKSIATIQFEINPSYSGTFEIKDMTWNYTTYTNQLLTGTYNYDNLEIPINKLSPLAANIEFTVTSNNIPYHCIFTIELDPAGQAAINALQGTTTIPCDIFLANGNRITYTLILP